MIKHLKTNTIIYIISFIYLCCFRSTCQKENDKLVFSINPISKINLGIKSKGVLIDSEVNIGYVWSEDGFLVSVDMEKEETMKKEQVCEVILFSVFISEEQYMLLSCEGQGIKVIELDKTGGFQVLEHQISSEHASKRMYLHQNNTLYSITGQDIIVYDISQPLAWQQLHVITNIENANTIAVSLEQKYTFITRYRESFKIFDIQEPGNPKLVIEDNFPGGYGCQDAIIHPNKTFVVVATRWEKVVLIDYSQFEGKPYPITPEYHSIYMDPTQSHKKDLHISHDGNYLFIVINSQGIFSVDISDPSRPELFQLIKHQSLNEMMFIPKTNNDFIYLTNSKDLIIYKKTELLYQSSNLFTSYLSELRYDEPTEEVWPWGQEVTHNSTRTWICYAIDGLRLYDTSNLPKMEFIKEYDESNVDGLVEPFYVHAHPDNENILIASSLNTESYNLVAIDFTNLNAPNVLFKKKYEYAIYHAIFLPQNSNKLIASSLSGGVFIIDITDIQNPQIVAEYMSEITQKKAPRQLRMSHDQKYIYQCTNSPGNIVIYSYDETQEKIEELQTVEFQLAYNVEISKLNPNILFVLSNLRGLKIFNIEGGKFEEISHITLEGFAWNIRLSENENELYIASTMKNQLTTLDISDYKNPQLFNILQFNSEESFKVIIAEQPSGLKYAIVNTFKGIRTVPLQFDVRLNTEVFQYNMEKEDYDNYDFSKKIGLFPEFNVGEQGMALFQILGDPFTKIIDSFYYYDPLDPKVLKSASTFMNFDPTYKKITFKALKDNIGINTVVTKIYKKIYTSELMFEPLLPQDQQEELAQQIYDRAQSFGYISSDGYPTDLFSIDKSIILLNDGGLQKYSPDLFDVIKTKIQFIPFSFQVQSSLRFNYLNPDESTTVFETFSEDLELNFKVDRERAQFFQQNFQGVLTSYSANKDTMIVVGKTQFINSIQEPIKIEVYNQNDKDTLELATVIDDGYNHKLEVTDLASKYIFIEFNKHVQEGKSIQEQFAGEYDDSEIFLEQEFQFIFSPDSFEDDDVIQYKMEVYIPETKKYQEIKQYETFKKFSINFLPNERMIKGSVLRSFFRQTMKIKITATDGYSESIQQLNIHANDVPFSILIYYIALGGSTFISLIGFIQYRGLIYGVFCRSKYRSGNMYFTEGEHFIIQLILSKEDTVIAQKLIGLFDGYLKKKKLKYENFLNDQFPDQYKFDRAKILSVLQQLDPDLDTLGFQNDNCLTYNIFKSLINQRLLNKNRQCKNLFNKLKKYAINKSKLNKHRWYEYYVEVKPQKVKDFYNLTPKVYFKLKPLLDAFMSLSSKNKRNSINQMQTFESYIESQIYDCYQLEDEEIRDQLLPLNDKMKDEKLFLLLENIRIEAWGFKPLNLFTYSFGQCIAKSISNIKIARGMQKRKSIFNPLFWVVNMDYIDIPLSKNMPLPTWMEYVCHHNVIELYGQIPIDTTSHNDKKDLVIRIEDIYNFICTEFHLIQVRTKKKNNLKGFKDQFINDPNYKVGYHTDLENKRKSERMMTFQDMLQKSNNSQMILLGKDHIKRALPAEAEAIKADTEIIDDSQKSVTKQQSQESDSDSQDNGDHYEMSISQSLQTQRIRKTNVSVPRPMEKSHMRNENSYIYSANNSNHDDDNSVILLNNSESQRHIRQNNGDTRNLQNTESIQQQLYQDKQIIQFDNNDQDDNLNHQHSVSQRQLIE